MSGAFFETYVVSEIIKNFYAYNKDPKEYLFYYRDIDQKEIDLIYVNAGDIYPIEVKKGIAPTKPTKNFDVLRKYKLNIKPGLIIDSCEKIRPINQNHRFNRWFAPPLSGVITGLTPKRGFEGLAPHYILRQPLTCGCLFLPTFSCHP